MIILINNNLNKRSNKIQIMKMSPNLKQRKNMKYNKKKIMSFKNNKYKTKKMLIHK